MVCGPSAGSYLRLTGALTTKGKQPMKGIHQIGEYEGIPAFKCPDEILPTNEILTV